MYNYENIERLTGWYKDVAKYELLNVDALLDELATQYSETGHAEYELSKLETKTGCPETYQYEVETIENYGDFDFIFKF